MWRAGIPTALRVWILLVLSAGPLLAQESEVERFRRFQAQEAQRFNQFVSAQDSAFASFLDREWRSLEGREAARPNVGPKIARPPVKVPAAGPSEGDVVVARIPQLPPLPTRSVVTRPVGALAPTALVPLAARGLPVRNPSPALDPVAGGVNSVTIPEARVQSVMVPFFVGELAVRHSGFVVPALGDPVSGQAIAAFYRELAAADWGLLAQDVRAHSERLELDDYAYAQFVLRLGRSLAGDENRARLLTWYLLLRSNIDARVAYAGAQGAGSLPAGTIVLLLPSTVMIYNAPYYTLSGERFFALSLDQAPSTMRLGSLFTYDGSYPGAPRKMDLRIEQTPQLGVLEESRTLRWQFGDSTYEIAVRADRNAVRYLEWFPQVDWDVWFGIRMSEPVRATLLPALRQQLRGRSEREQVNFLLRFVQTAFAYKTDAQQFGREKPLSVDETLLYPFSDCEDRSVLFAALVRELTGLEVVGLSYPGHLATAVRFREAVPGDAVLIAGQRWLVSDPTYDGADVGEVMPEFKSVLPSVIRIR